MVIVHDPSVVEGRLHDLQAVLGSSGGHAHHGEAAKNETGLRDPLEHQEHLHFPISSGLQQLVLFVEEVVTPRGQQFAVLIAMVVPIVVDDPAPWVDAVRPVRLLACVGQDALGGSAVVPEAAYFLSEQPQLTQRMSTELSIGLVAVEGTDRQIGLGQIIVLMGDVNYPGMIPPVRLRSRSGY